VEEEDKEIILWVCGLVAGLSFFSITSHSRSTVHRKKDDGGTTNRIDRLFLS